MLRAHQRWVVPLLLWLGHDYHCSLQRQMIGSSFLAQLAWVVEVGLDLPCGGCLLVAVFHPLGEQDAACCVGLALARMVRWHLLVELLVLFHSVGQVVQWGSVLCCVSHLLCLAEFETS